MNIKVAKETPNNSAIDDQPNFPMDSQNHRSISLEEKVRVLAIEGHISPFLAKEFIKYIGRGVEFERKGA